MEIRKAKKEDVKDIQKLRYLLAKYEKDLGLNIVIPEWAYTDVGEKDFNYFLNEQYIFVAIEDNKIVGFITGEIFKKKAWYNVQLGEINNIFVLEEYRQKGIGKKLVKTMIDTFKQEGITNIDLYTFGNNIDAIKFYEKIGFKKYNVQMLYEKDNISRRKNETSSNI